MQNNIIGAGWAFPLNIDAQGGLALTSQRSELEQAIVIILSTSIGERVMRPTFGSRLNELIYEPCDGRALALAEQYVRDALAMWEPRIQVDEVRAEIGSGKIGMILIDIEFTIKTTNDKRSLVYPFYNIPEEL